MEKPLSGITVLDISRIPLTISDCDLDVELPPPAFAAHTGKILKSYIGMSESQIHQLRDEGVIA